MHLLVAITSHGFGHAAQVAPVLAALRQRLPSLQLTVMSGLPAAFLRGRISGGFRLIAQAPDFGLVMKSAFEIDHEASAEAYAVLHRDWEARVEQEARRLVALAPDLILADIPYLTLAAAQAAGIPALALCSLNWADIYRWYFSTRKESRTVLESMEDAYRSAQAFLCPEPSMPMPFLDNRVKIEAIASRGRCQRQQLARRLNIDDDEALVLVAPGGVHARFEIEAWPAGQGIRWLVPDSWTANRADCVPIGRCGLEFRDLIASCDAVLGKCGYGTVTECVVNRTPLLYIDRPDWPEQQTLASWLEAHNAGIRVDPQDVRTGTFGELVQHARSLSVKHCAAGGAAQAARALERYFPEQACVVQ